MPCSADPAPRRQTAKPSCRTCGRSCYPSQINTDGLCSKCWRSSVPRDVAVIFAELPDTDHPRGAHRERPDRARPVRRQFPDLDLGDDLLLLDHFDGKDEPQIPWSLDRSRVDDIKRRWQALCGGPRWAAQLAYIEHRGGLEAVARVFPVPGMVRCKNPACHRESARRLDGQPGEITEGSGDGLGRWTPRLCVGPGGWCDDCRLAASEERERSAETNIFPTFDKDDLDDVLSAPDGDHYYLDPVYRREVGRLRRETRYRGPHRGHSAGWGESPSAAAIVRHRTYALRSEEGHDHIGSARGRKAATMPHAGHRCGDADGPERIDPERERRIEELKAVKDRGRRKKINLPGELLLNVIAQRNPTAFKALVATLRDSEVKRMKVVYQWGLSVKDTARKFGTSSSSVSTTLCALKWKFVDAGLPVPRRIDEGRGGGSRSLPATPEERERARHAPPCDRCGGQRARRQDRFCASCKRPALAAARSGKPVAAPAGSPVDAANCAA